MRARRFEKGSCSDYPLAVAWLDCAERLPQSAHVAIHPVNVPAAWFAMGGNVLLVTLGLLGYEGWRFVRSRAVS